MKKLALTLIALCISSLALLNAQQKTQKELFQATYNKSKALVENQQFSYVGEVVYNNKKREMLNAESNTIAINKSEISGKVASLRADDLLFDLNGVIENFEISYDDDKQFIAINFKINTSNQKLDVFIDVKPNGKAFLTVSSGSQSKISWTGHLK